MKENLLEFTVILFVSTFVLLPTCILLIFLPDNWVWSREHIKRYGRRQGIINKIKHAIDFNY
jgi:hypothetical protein